MPLVTHQRAFVVRLAGQRKDPEHLAPALITQRHSSTSVYGHEAGGLLAFARGSSSKSVAAVALANKNARIVWAMLAGNVSYEPARSVQAD
jgi:hypothetical protein